MDDNKPLEYQIEVAAEGAGDGLERVVSILERMEKSISGVASSLSTLNSASSGITKSFDRIKAGNSRAFDSKRVLDFSKRMIECQRAAKSLSKSGSGDELGLSKALSDGVKEAERLNKAMNKMDTNSPAYKAASVELEKQMGLLDDLMDKREELNRQSVSKRKAEIAAVVDRNMNKTQQTAEVDPNEIKSVQLKGYKGFAADHLTGDKSKEEQRRTVAIDVEGVDKLANAQSEMERLHKAVQRNENNIIKFTLAGDAKNLGRERAKLSQNLEALKAFSGAAVRADAPYKEMSTASEIKIENVGDLERAEKAAAKLERAIENDTAALRKFAAAEDAAGFEKMRNRIIGANFELERYRTAISAASGMKLGAEQSKALEDTYTRINKLQAQIGHKEFLGKNAFNSSAVRKLQIDLTEARKEALRLKIAMGQISGGKAMAQNMALTAKGLVQSRFHAFKLNQELKRSEHSLLKVSRVLQLMAVRMGVRAVLKDLNVGFATLGDAFDPFNDSVSNVMDSVTRVRNSVISVFDPLIRVAAPIVEKILNRVAVGFDRVAQAAAAMTGETMYTRLTSDAQDYAKTVNDVQKSLAGFDKFNTIGEQTYVGGVKYKTEVERVPVEDRFKKWKKIGDGLKELFEGIGEVATTFFDNIAKALGKMDNEDTLEFLGEKLKDAGDWLKEHKDLVANLTTAYLLLKAAIGPVATLLTVVGGAKKGYDVIKALFKGGTVASGAGNAAGTGVFGKIAGKLGMGGTKAAGTAAGGSLAGSGAGAAALSFAEIAIMGAVVAKGIKDITPDVKAFGEEFKNVWGQLKENRVARGKDDSFLGTLGEFTREAWLNFVDPNHGKDLVPNTEPTYSGFTPSISGSKQNDITKAVSDGVERAVTNALSNGSTSVNVTVKAEAQTDKLFKFVVQENNSQYNRTGKSPLKV